MNYGLYMASSGVQTALSRLGVASNNLANVNTVGFKPDFQAIMQRDVERTESNLPFLKSSSLLERLGGGVLAAPTRTSQTPAASHDTGNPLDVAIVGEGFFVLSEGEGGSGGQLRFTRDGAMTLDAGGRLVQLSSGLPVLDARGGQILLDPTAPASISTSGAISQYGSAIAQLQIATLSDPDSLEKAGQNLFRVKAGREPEVTASQSIVRPGALENSGVNPITAMMEVSKASRSARDNTRMIQLIDEMMGRAINTFARLG